LQGAVVQVAGHAGALGDLPHLLHGLLGAPPIADVAGNIVEAPTILPFESLIGETLRDMSILLPSLVRRTVS
jgi:hypothetical protein